MDIITSDSYRAHIQMKDTQTKLQRAKQLYGNYTFDCTLPQNWVDETSRKLGVRQDAITSGFVWLYIGTSRLGGEPAPLNLDACDLLARLEKLGD